MKILMKKRSFVKVEMAGLLGVKVPCLMPNRVKRPLTTALLCISDRNTLVVYLLFSLSLFLKYHLMR